VICQIDQKQPSIFVISAGNQRQIFKWENSKIVLLVNILFIIEKLHHIEGLPYVRQKVNCAVKANIPTIFNYAFTLAELNSDKWLASGTVRLYKLCPLNKRLGRSLFLYEQGEEEINSLIPLRNQSLRWFVLGNLNY
jgi:hypothetical protein